AGSRRSKTRAGSGTRASHPYPHYPFHSRGRGCGRSWKRVADQRLSARIRANVPGAGSMALRPPLPSAFPTGREVTCAPRNGLSQAIQSFHHEPSLAVAALSQSSALGESLSLVQYPYFFAAGGLIIPAM